MKNAGYMRKLVNEYDQKNLEKFEEEHINIFIAIEQSAEYSSKIGITSIDYMIFASVYEQNQYVKILDNYGYKNEWSCQSNEDCEKMKFLVKISW